VDVLYGVLDQRPRWRTDRVFAEAVRRGGVAVVVRDYLALIHGFFGMG